MTPIIRVHSTLALMALLPFAAGGCHYSVNVAPNDEAMTAAVQKGISAEEATRRFYPADAVNFFQGMDAVARSESSDVEDVDPRHAPVYQLLDKASPKIKIVDPVTSDSEIRGRNTWMMWCGGNEGFWDWLANFNLGFIDLLKVVDSRNYSTRFRDAGLINEPGMVQASEADQFGLWLDVPEDEEVRAMRDKYLDEYFKRSRADRYLPAEVYGGEKAQTKAGDEQPTDVKAKYDRRFPPPEIYGLSSGVIGLRLFPNPNFDPDAWKGESYYAKESFYTNPKLQRPFRVGMSCAFCHASFHPLKPPRDITHPQWENISGSIGAQYLRTRAVFGSLLKKNNFVYHILDAQPPGTIDTSMIATDNINNPNAMNAVFCVAQRVELSLRNPKEKLSASSASLPTVWTDPKEEPTPNDPHPTAKTYRDLLGELSENQIYDLKKELEESNRNPRQTTRVLIDGSDSIGMYGALARVYLNIGTYYERWIQLHNTVVGFQPQRPFTIDDCENHSVYWRATRDRVGHVRDYFLKITPPMPLLAADGAADKAKELSADQEKSLGPKKRGLRIDVSKLARGRQVFAKNCIICHSSVQPDERFAALEKTSSHDNGFWDHNPGRWLDNPDYQKWALEKVEERQFWQLNFLSTDYRVPITLVGTNSARALGTNAISGHMWADFASESYRLMPSVGPISFFNPYLGANGRMDSFTPRHRAEGGATPGGGGPGYFRPASLVSVWATAPLLHNNSLGTFNNDPTVDGRLAAFDDAIHKLLWPERRLESSSFNDATPERLQRDHGLIWRTSEESYLTISARHLPDALSQVPLIARFRSRFTWLEVIDPPWWPSLVLLVIAYIFLLWSRKKGMRTLGYAAVLLALFGGLFIYAMTGRIGDLRVGPIPKGTPVNLISNVNPDAPQLKRSVKRILSSLGTIESQHLDEEKKQKAFREQIAPQFMEINKCPDFVMDKGHYFEWFKTMTDDDKEALIELLKTF